MNGNTQIHQESIPRELNTPAQTRANTMGSPPPVGSIGPTGPIPAQPVNLVPGGQAGCDPLRKTMDSSAGEARVYGQRQLDADGF
jgi:hypothetical protein